MKERIIKEIIGQGEKEKRTRTIRKRAGTAVPTPSARLNFSHPTFYSIWEVTSHLLLMKNLYLSDHHQY